MKKNLKFIIILVLLVLSGVYSWSSFFKTYTQKDTYDVNQFPKTIGGWNSEELTITDEEYAILETRNAFARRYFNAEGQEVIFYTIYSQHNRKVSHPPEVCYTGSGLSVLSHNLVSIPLSSNSKEKQNMLEVNRLSLEQGQVKEVSYYWFKVGNSFTPSYWKQQFLIAFKSLVGKPASSAMIRVSAAIRQDNVQKAEKDSEDFMKLILPKLYEFLP